MFTRNLFRFSRMLAESARHRPSLDVSEIAVVALVETSAFLIRHGAGFLVESHLGPRQLHSQQDQLNVNQAIFLEQNRFDVIKPELNGIIGTRTISIYHADVSPPL